MKADCKAVCRGYEDHTCPRAHLTVGQAVHRQVGRRTLFLVLMFLLMLGTMAVGLCVGASGMDPGDVLVSLVKDTGRNHSIVWMLRLPRILMAVLVGFGLGPPKSPGLPFYPGGGISRGLRCRDRHHLLGQWMSSPQGGWRGLPFLIAISGRHDCRGQNETSLIRDHNPNGHCADVFVFGAHFPFPVYGNHAAGLRGRILVFRQPVQGGLG